MHQQISDCLMARFESERVRYAREIETFDEILNEKLMIESGKRSTGQIDEALLHRDIQMNNLWAYIMSNGYVVLFIDNAAVGSQRANLYGTSLAYDETCEKLVNIRKLCSEIGFQL